MFPYRETNPGRPARSLVTILTELHLDLRRAVSFRLQHECGREERKINGEVWRRGRL